MRTPEILHLPQHVPAVVEDVEHLAVRAAHAVAHEAGHAVDAALAPLSAHVDLDGVMADEDVEDWD